MAVALVHTATFDLAEPPEPFRLETVDAPLQRREVFLDMCVGKLSEILRSQEGNEIVDRAEHTFVS
jgi:hypothetical protein